MFTRLDVLHTCPSLGGLEELEEVLLEGYLDGLHLVGWRSDPRAVRLGYLVDVALRHSNLPYGVVVFSDEVRQRIEHAFGMPLDELMDRYVEYHRFMVSRGEEAFELAQALR